MKNTRTVKVVVLIAALFGLTSALFWNLAGGGTPAGAAAEERANQERIRSEMPPPNESSPRHSGAADTPN